MSIATLSPSSLAVPWMGRGCDSVCSSPPSMLSPKCSGRCVHTGSIQSQSTRGQGRAPRTLPFGSWTWLVWSGSPSPEGFPCAPGSEPQCPLTGERHPPEGTETNDDLRLGVRFNKFKMNVCVVKEWDDWQVKSLSTLHPTYWSIHLLHKSCQQSTLISFHPPSH